MKTIKSLAVKMIEAFLAGYDRSVAQQKAR